MSGWLSRIGIVEGFGGKRIDQVEIFGSVQDRALASRVSSLDDFQDGISYGAGIRRIQAMDGRLMKIQGFSVGARHEDRNAA